MSIREMSTLQLARALPSIHKYCKSPEASHNYCESSKMTSHFIIKKESHIRALVLLNLLNSLRYSVSLAFISFPNSLIRSIKHEHSCKSLYVCNKRGTHVRDSIYFTVPIGSPLLSPLTSSSPLQIFKRL